MGIGLHQLADLDEAVEVVVHSLERSLYQMTVVVGGVEQALLDKSGRPLVYRSISAARDQLSGLRVARLTLRQRSAYDEMIGQPPRQVENTLEVGLAVAVPEPRVGRNYQPDQEEGA